VIVDVCPAGRLAGEAVKLVSVTGETRVMFVACELAPVETVIASWLPFTVLAAVTENVALVAPATTATDAGADTIELDDEICRVNPVEGAAADKRAVIVDVCPADRLAGEAVKLVSVTGGTRVMFVACELAPVETVIAAWLPFTVLAAVTENVALVAPATTATDAGAEIIGLDDEICRVIPVEGAAADREAVIVDVCPADRLVGEAVKPVTEIAGMRVMFVACELAPVETVIAT